MSTTDTPDPLDVELALLAYADQRLTDATTPPPEDQP